ncbi:benzoate/H(+) symporter BenE family transporter [Xinfangfangia sp. CPCC 101601]|uniref:Benzoate/H(+) symporter BenE family transporter n=1 Tax=Pseudogemmobacter lacusdianii TaxID=3069608 RepID=A0ABU0VTF0_9RHOB|nr:benzoate/H(+) symporter BenE family transporter [Xinfangfangia sp. CPCC 101601]MDQ2065011.1 benzoate/H(+) symporter BenE family transporter [Xinfangfangia sp. CPCC 101601]
MRASVITAAFVAALVGYGSTIALVLAAAAAVGATAEQTASWLLAVCLAKAVGGALLSFWHRVPVVLAWSTPGTALVAATQGLSLEIAVGAFVLTGVLIALTGLLRPLGRAVAMIPDGISGGMLAGVLLPFVLQGAVAAETAPLLVLPMLLVFALVRLKSPAFAVIVALVAGVALAFASGSQMPALSLSLPQLVLISPAFELSSVIGLAIPLYLVTMASQNLPGFATMRAAGFEPPVRSALGVTGLVSTLSAFFGAHTTSMAAITAAICMGDDVHPDRSQRWKVGLAYAGFWVLLGLFSPLLLTLLGALPPQVMMALVALALLGALTGALATAMAKPEQRFAAVLTLAVTTAGVPFLGIGAAFWGLVLGVAFQLLERTRPKP